MPSPASKANARSQGNAGDGTSRRVRVRPLVIRLLVGTLLTLGFAWFWFIRLHVQVQWLHVAPSIDHIGFTHVVTDDGTHEGTFAWSVWESGCSLELSGRPKVGSTPQGQGASDASRAPAWAYQLIDVPESIRLATGDGRHITTESGGLPFRCLSYCIVQHQFDPDGPARREPELLGEWEVPWGPLLPIHPFWPGLLADVAIWSLIAHLLLWSGRSVRRWNRRRRGHCPSCGYSRRGLPSDICPECGTRN